MTDDIRKAFPILQETINGHPLIYMDNAATTQKPRQVIDAISRYYLHQNANVHRGVHTLSQKATDLFEASREEVRS
ncbi:TPA: cysteine desulfurase CsdA, partial [Candidatus Marinimicrobia bacterium]|nr:cysteine desulfurase CsdA [Candidatus Neomarinimicrobiota bacterium]